MTLLLAAAAVLSVACGSGASEPARAGRVAGWATFIHVARPVDLATRGAGGALVLAARGRLWILPRHGAVTPFAPRYSASSGEEPYIAVAQPGHRGCSFGRGFVYALRLSRPRGITEIQASGRVRRFATITAPGRENGIAFDEAGRFGYRLLVTINDRASSTVDAVDCRGRVSTITRRAPRVEGGIAVAPRGFGRFAGDLIAPDEIGGGLYAISPGGASTLLARPGLPHGQDIGVESEGFVPARRTFTALLADRITLGNRHPGDDVLLALSSATLRGAGVRAGDLLVAGEGGALLDAVRCGPVRCFARQIAGGPAIAHAEGHIAFW
ncbi:MAG: hypothetical protein ACYC91_03455 [Solirubrobacteraceae bacterium]